MKVIAHIKSDFPEKFGIPRQSGLVKSLKAEIIFTQGYRNKEALRGLEDFSHLWLIWEFSKAKRDTWSPTVRPPRLGGNTRIGVFATRSPFRPNPIGLSSVKFEGIRYDKELGPVITVSGADLMDGTPIYDIKPYIPYADCHTDATGGFTDNNQRTYLQVENSGLLSTVLPEDKAQALIDIIKEDPRPSYQNDGDRIYGMDFAGYNVKFKVEQTKAYIISVEKL